MLYLVLMIIILIFFFNSTPTTEIYTLSLHDALPIFKWLETNNLFNNLIQRNQSAAFSSGKVRPNHETNINIIARRTGKRSEERLAGMAETDVVCRLLLEKKKAKSVQRWHHVRRGQRRTSRRRLQDHRRRTRKLHAFPTRRSSDLLETNNLFNNLIQRNQSAAFSSGKVRPNHETNINIIARRTGKDVNSHTVLDGIITTIMATIQRINIIGSREGSRNRRRLKANQTGKKFRVGIKSNISTNRNNLISGVDRCIHLNAMKKTTITSINRQTIKI